MSGFGGSGFFRWRGDKGLVDTPKPHFRVHQDCKLWYAERRKNARADWEVVGEHEETHPGSALEWLEKVTRK
jgi:hypothetical protein